MSDAREINRPPDPGGAQQDWAVDLAGLRERARPVDPLMSCLLRVSQHFDRPIGEADIRAACPIPKNGMSLETLCMAAERIGYRARIIGVKPATIDKLPMPFVLAGDKDTTPRLVFNSWESDFVVFNPSGNKTETLSRDEALQGARQAILLKPARGADETGRDASNKWRSLVGSRIKRILWELFLASMVINLFALATPLFMMTVYNKVIGQNALSTLHVLALGMVIVYGFDFLLRAVRGYIATHTGARLDALIGSEVIHHLLRLPYRYFEATPTGLISERLRQLDNVRQFFCGLMPITLVDLLFVSLFLAALFWIQPLLAGITLAAMPVMLSLALYHQHKSLSDRNFMALASKASALAEMTSNALTIKALGLEGDMEKRWGDRLAMSAWTAFKVSNVANITNVAGAVLQQVTNLAIIFIGAYLVTTGDLTIGGLIGASLLATRALAPMRHVVSAWHQLQEVRASFRRIDAIMDQPTEVHPGELAPLPNIEGDVTLDRVAFQYDPNLPPVLKDMDLKIKSASMVGIMGPSGCGKSTLAKLIQGLYRPTSGRIMIDGTDINHMSPPALRSQVGVVPQETQLFAATVRENMAMGAGTVEPRHLVAVSKLVGAHDFIQRLPKGYDTLLSERGGGLSAGQRQLICIARALMRDPQILILDEATSDLDVAVEQRLISNLRQAYGERTIIFISHRLGPLSAADTIAFVIDGRIEHVGPPKETIPLARARMSQKLETK